jgi:hypothetical protein
MQTPTAACHGTRTYRQKKLPNYLLFLLEQLPALPDDFFFKFRAQAAGQDTGLVSL